MGARGGTGTVFYGSAEWSDPTIPIDTNGTEPAQIQQPREKLPMTEPDKADPDEEIPFKRRNFLKLAGSAGAIGAFGAEPATAQPSDQLIVGTPPGRAGIAQRGASEVRKTLNFGDIGQAVVGRWPEQALNGLQNNPNIRYIEPDRHGTRHQQTLPWGVDRVDAEIAHASGDTGDSIDVGIIDSGIDSDHDDLEDNLGEGFALAAACSSCAEEWDDQDGHGTAVAGIVGGIDNGIDVVGVAPDVTLHALKDGDTTPQTSATAEALETAADEGYDVANISSSLGETNTLEDAINYAVNNDVVIVASAGNGGPCTDCVSFPARHDDVIAVTNIQNDDTLANTSNQGPEIDLGAPGRGVTTTGLNGGTTGFGGTSAAAPHVAAAAAQLLANGSSPSNVGDDLKDAAEDIGLGGNVQGAGLLDLANALGHDSANDLTEVETGFADDLGYTEARLNGEITQLTGNADAEVFFQYREVGTTSWTGTTPETRTGTGSFDSTITGLEQDTSYEFRAGVTVDEPSEGWSSTESGDIDTFETVDNPEPTASFTVDPSVPDPGEDVEFDGSSSDPGESVGVSEPDSIVSYDWDFENDGTFDDSGETVNHTFTDPGDVTVRLRVTDEFGQTDERTQTLRVNEAPEAVFEWSPNVPNEGDEIAFDASDSVDSDGDVVSYEWDFDTDTTVDATGETATHNYGPAGDGNWGEFDVTLTVTDNDGATNEVTETVRVNAYPIAEPIDVLVEGEPVDPVENPVVRGEPVEFDASASDDPDGAIDEYAWNFGDRNTGTGETVTHTYDEGGEKTVTLTVTDDDNASHDTISVHERTFTVHVRVAVEIKPDKINPRRPGNVPVAVIHTADFDPPTELDPATVRFGAPEEVNVGNGAEPTHDGGHIEDGDWIGHFPLRETGFENGDDEGKLVGERYDGVPVFGFDEITSVGGGRP